MDDGNNSPTGSTPSRPHTSEAADLIRRKLEAIYAHEPSAKEEIAEIAHTSQKSPHQRYMEQLTKSGLSLAEIQTAWHQYYAKLPDQEKHEVWQEFYNAHKSERGSTAAVGAVSASSLPSHSPSEANSHRKPRHKQTLAASHQAIASARKQLGHIRQKHRRSPPARLSRKQHAQSLMFGISFGSIALLLFLFGFFNERFIAPFITPSRQVSSTPIINDPNDTNTGPEEKVIIPKINVEIPVVYDEPSIEEKALQKALEHGVVHYATTPAPGEKGNAVIFGHSSNNILNQGKYKFAFVLLSRLEAGDTFYLTYGGTRYTYKVYEKKIVKPTDLGVLSDAGKTATATLITCDPPGTSLNRLVVIGEQINPDPNGNKTSTAVKTNTQPTIIPSNAPSLWQRIKDLFH